MKLASVSVYCVTGVGVFSMSSADFNPFRIEFIASLVTIFITAFLVGLFVVIKVEKRQALKERQNGMGDMAR